jgi:hypothetical protein
MQKYIIWETGASGWYYYKSLIFSWKLVDSASLTIKFDRVGTRFSTVEVVNSHNCCCVNLSMPLIVFAKCFPLSTFSEKELSLLAQTLLLSLFFLIFQALHVGTFDAPAALVCLLTMNFKCLRNDFFVHLMALCVTSFVCVVLFLFLHSSLNVH